MATLNRLERLRLAALRLRQIQNEEAAIYRDFPELDRRPQFGRRHRPRTAAGHGTQIVVSPAKLH